MNSNDWINTDFIVWANSGYRLSLSNTASGNWSTRLSVSDETDKGELIFYVQNSATGAISAAVTEHYKIDKTAPTGTAKLDERTPFEEFLHKITFGLFFKDDVAVRLTASDEASGVKSVEYYRSDKALTLEEVKALTAWTADDSFGITAEDMARFVIYARITDNAGNITYLSSDGAEFDTTAPEIIGVENGETYYVACRVAFDDVKLTDKDEIERISKIIDDLTDNEKALIGEDTLCKLKDLNEKLTELADNAKKPTSPSTGDTSNLALWIALLFISGGVITGVTVAGKKKKQQGR